MTWVRSANAADTWGRNYVYFTSNLSPIVEEENEDVSVDEVDTFLSSFNELPEEEQEENQPQENVELQEEQNNIDYVPFTTYNTQTVT